MSWLLLAELAQRTRCCPARRRSPSSIYIDSMQKRVYGHHRQGAAFGHTKIGGKSLLVRGLNTLAATISTPIVAPVIAATRLRGGNAGSARARRPSPPYRSAPGHRMRRDAGGAGRLGVYSAVFTGAVRRAGAFFSVTVRMDPKIKAAIATIPDGAWTPIRYPRAIWDDQLRAWVSEAQVAEAEYTAFISKKGQAITARLIVRRVKDRNRAATEGQDELFPVWRYHAVFTDPPFATLQAEQHHRPGGAGVRRLDRRPAGPPAIWLVSRERGMGGLRRHQSQPASCRRLPGQPRLRQGARRHDAPRPDRRRRPNRPTQLRRNHPAPARRMAPRTRLDEPVRSRLWPAPRYSAHGPGGQPAGRQPRSPASDLLTARRRVSGRKVTPTASLKIRVPRPSHQK